MGKAAIFGERKVRPHLLRIQDMTETKLVLTVQHKKPLPPDLLRMASESPEVFLDEEVWRPYLPYPAYEVSSLGNVRRIHGLAQRRDGKTAFVRGGPIRLSRLPSGYLNWGPSCGGKQASVCVHRAVMEAFLGPRPGLVVRHLNGVRDDNRLLNLAWGTYSDNESDKVRHGTAPRGERHGASKLTAKQVKAIRADARSSSAIASEMGVSANQVWRIKKGLAWAHLGD